MSRFASSKGLAVGVAIGLWTWGTGLLGLNGWIHDLSVLALATPLVPHPGWVPVMSLLVSLCLLGMAKTRGRIGYLACGDFWNLYKWQKSVMRGIISVLSGLCIVGSVAWLSTGSTGGLIVAIYGFLLAATFVFYQACLAQLALSPWLRRKRSESISAMTPS